MAAVTVNLSRRHIAAGLAAGVGIVLFVAACGPADDSTASGSAGGGPSFDWLGRTVAVDDAQAMVVQVDPGRTLTASPGQGVGLFAQYQAGGHWQLTWSCDTQLTGQSCPYQVTVVSRGGAITNAMALAPQAGDTLTQPAPEEIDTATLTSTALSGATFDTPAGAQVDVDVLIDGAKAGVTLFFVQNGTVNGGYAGALTDPLVFEPLSP
jgi:hypothetical protein